MIIGAIESSSGGTISGWIHCRTAVLTGEVVLAFLDGVCVGSGEVGDFRMDLRNAGLDDGRLGFSFPISVANPDDASRVVVSLSGCEAFLLPTGARVINSDASASPDAYICGSLPDPARLNWIGATAGVDPADCDVVRTLIDFGVANEKTDWAGAEDRLRQLFELAAFGPVRLGHVDLESDVSIPTFLADHAPALRSGLFALIGERRTTVSVQETPFAQPGTRPDSPVVGGLEYMFGPNMALVLRRWTPFAANRILAGRVRCYFPLPPDDDLIRTAPAETTLRRRTAS